MYCVAGHTLSATATGGAYLPFAIPMAGLSRWSGGLSDRVGAKIPLPPESRAVQPRDYLEPAGFGELVKRGIEAGGEAALTLYFDASRTRATGYRLVLFYPS